MRRASGFIFVTTLIFISVLSLLVLSIMQHSLIYYKAIRGLERQHRHFYLMESLALQLMKQTMVKQPCIIKGSDANGVLLKLIQHQGCLIQSGSLQFQYLFEDLGDFPCLIVQQGKKKFSTHHRRLSILLASKGAPDSFLQIRAIEAIEAKPCEQKEHVVSLGISSWRYLSSL